MSNIIIGILAVVHVCSIVIVLCYKSLQIVYNRYGKDNPIGTGIAAERTLHVLLIILRIYFIPLIALAIALACNPIMVGPIMLLIFGITIFLLKKIIPITEKKRIELENKYYYGKDAKTEEIVVKKEIR